MSFWKSLLARMNPRAWILLGTVGVLLAYLGFFSPLFSTTMALKREVHAKKSKYAFEQRLIQEVDRHKEQYAQYAGELSFGDGLSNEKAQALFLKGLEERVDQAGLYISDIKVVPPREEPQYTLLLIQMEMTGSLEQWLSLVYGIAATKELLRIEDFSVERKGSDNTQLFVKAVFARVKMV